MDNDKYDSMLNKLCDSATKKLLATNEDFEPFITLYNEELSKEMDKPMGEFFTSNRAKAAVNPMLKTLLDLVEPIGGIDALFITSVSWTLTLECKSENELPDSISDHPDRSEAIIITAVAKGLGEVTLVQPFKRTPIGIEFGARKFLRQPDPNMRTCRFFEGIFTESRLQ